MIFMRNISSTSVVWASVSALSGNCAAVYDQYIYKLTLSLYTLPLMLPKAFPKSDSIIINFVCLCCFR